MSRTRCDAPTVIAASPATASSRARATLASTSGPTNARSASTRTPCRSSEARWNEPSNVGSRAAATSPAGTTNTPAPSPVPATTAISSARSPSTTWRVVPSSTQPSPSGRARTSPAANAPAPVPPAHTAPSSRPRASAAATARTSGTYWLVVARNGEGSAARPSSSSVTISSTAVSPMPPSSAGTVRLGQSRSTNVFHSPRASSLPSTTARTSAVVHSRPATSRTTPCSSRCSSVSSKSTGGVLLALSSCGTAAARCWPAARGR